MSEQWTRWEPIQELSQKYNIDTILNTFAELDIVLSEIDDKRKKVRVTFENFIKTYRRTDESIRSILIDKYGPIFFEKWTFFKVDNSSYAQWLFEESCGIVNSSDQSIHFSFVAGNSILDVITTCEPKVEFVD